MDPDTAKPTREEVRQALHEKYGDAYHAPVKVGGVLAWGRIVSVRSLFSFLNLTTLLNFVSGGCLVSVGSAVSAGCAISIGSGVATGCAISIASGTSIGCAVSIASRKSIGTAFELLGEPGDFG